MPPLLYLDTARLGQMTPAAKDAQLDFVRLSAEEPSSLYFEQFLRDGFSAWPLAYQNRFPGLRTWTGIAGLKRSLQQVAGAPASWATLLASRSLSLVQLGASCMFRVCRNVLTTDLSWSTYQHVIELRARRTSNRVTTVSLRDQILKRKWTTHDVGRFLVQAFVDNHCDGLFLPAVDHLGIRLPIWEIVHGIEQAGEQRFCLIDAAQAFCHVPLDECVQCADFVVAGSHKWMGAYLPTGVAWFGQHRSRETIQQRLRYQLASGRIGDPLLQFTEQLDADELDGHSETVNLANLFACAGAATDHLNRSQSPLHGTRWNLDDMLAVVSPPASDWHPLRPAEPMQSRVVLFDTKDPATMNQPADALRQIWLDAGLVVSAYAGGRVRTSLSANT